MRTPAPRLPARGFTLIELLIATAVAAVLAAIAYPSFEAPLRKGRRSDALTALMQLQLAQERWRAEHTEYASLSELHAAAISPNGHYHLAMSDTGHSRFAATATAITTGRQARDHHCQVLSLRREGGNTLYASGPDASAANPADINRSCWGH